MPADVAMCQNASCLLRHWCLRYRAIPSGADQTWSAFVPRLGFCSDLVSISESDKIVAVEVADARNVKVTP